MDYNKWKRFKRNGGYRRKVKSRYQDILKHNAAYTSESISMSKVKTSVQKIEEGSVVDNVTPMDDISDHGEECDVKYDSSEYETDNDDKMMDFEKNRQLVSDIKSWSIKFNISHAVRVHCKKYFNVFNGA